MLFNVILVRSTVGTTGQYTNLSPTEARHLINNNHDLVILDVRNKTEYDIGHLCNALLVPLNTLNATVSFWIQSSNGSLNAPNLNDEILVYCASGSRSAAACQILIEYNYTRVYNLAGGINAWIDAGNDISTTYHLVTYDFIQNQTRSIDIQPLLKSYCGCNSYDSACQIDPWHTNCTATEFFKNMNKTVIEATTDQSIINYQGTFNSTTVDYTTNETLLWSSSSFEDQINRTLTFKYISVVNGSEVRNYYSLAENVEKIDSFNMSITTMLTPLDNGTYSQALTYISFKPVDEGYLQTVETITTNSTLKLSDLYISLHNVVDKLAREYGKSDDQGLHKFEQRYSFIANEAKLISKIVSQNLTAYNKDILKSSTLLVDDWWACLLCQIAFNALLAGGCGVIAACTYGLAAAICAYMGAIDWMGTGVDIICNDLLDCWGEPQPPHDWIGTYIESFTDPGYSYVDLPWNVVGDGPVWGYSMAFMRTWQAGGVVHIFGQMTDNTGEYVHGDIQCYCATMDYNGAYVLLYGSQDYVNWQYLSGQFIPNPQIGWNDFGYTTTCFKYIDIILWQPWGSYYTTFEVDCVVVTP
jgi:rhodanese-related sulfurtransferase